MLNTYLRLLRHFWRLNISREAQYRANFIALGVVGIIEAIITVLPMMLLYSFTDELDGWSRGESIALVGLFRTAMAIYLLMAGSGLNMLSQAVRTGELDLLLIRPVNAQFMVTFRYVSLPQLVNVVIGMLIFGIGVSQSGLSFEISHIVVFLTVFVAGLILLTAAISAGSYLAFRATTVEGLPWLMHDFASMGQYPISFYPVGVRVFLTAVVPVAFVTVIPINVLRGTGGWETGLVAIAFAVGAVFTLRWWWNNSVRHYASASS
jgi:ABC-2 type transport system permease protein